MTSVDEIGLDSDDTPTTEPRGLKFRALERGDVSCYSMKCVQSEKEEAARSDYRKEIEDTIQISLWGTRESDGWEAVEAAAKWLDKFFSKDMDGGEDISDLKSLWTQISTGDADPQTSVEDMRERAYHRRDEYRKYYENSDAKMGEKSSVSSPGRFTGKRTSAEIKANNRRLLKEYKQSNKRRWEKDLTVIAASLNKEQGSEGSSTLTISTVPTIASTA